MVIVNNQVEVLGEKILFINGVNSYELKNRIAEVILKVVGVKNSSAHTFRINKDYYLDKENNRLVWLRTGDKPDSLTSFFVDYVYVAVPKDIPFTEEQYGRDIRLQPTPNNSLQLDIQPNSRGDLLLVGLRNNLTQALKLKLMLIKGYYKPHPQLGSELFNLVGENMTNENLELLKLYVIEALNEDPRVSEIDSVEVVGDRLLNKVLINAKVIPIGSHEPLNLVYDFFIDDVGRNYL